MEPCWASAVFADNWWSSEKEKPTLLWFQVRVECSQTLRAKLGLVQIMVRFQVAQFPCQGIHHPIFNRYVQLLQGNTKQHVTLWLPLRGPWETAGKSWWQSIHQKISRCFWTTGSLSDMYSCSHWSFGLWNNIFFRSNYLVSFIVSHISRSITFLYQFVHFVFWWKD